MDMKIFVTPVVGAIIGYCTNWLAIKMLFRPYNEKKFLGIRVPFTPGLIPKERDRLSNKTGEVIEEYLLTNEVIINELTSDDTNALIYNYIETNFFTDEDNISIKKIISILDNEELIVSENVKQVLQDMIVKSLSEPVTKSKLIELISSMICSELKQVNLEDILANKFIQDNYINGIHSEEFKGYIADKLDKLFDEDKRVSDIIDGSLIQNIKGVLKYHTPSIIESLKNILKNDTVRTKVINLIDETVKAKVGALGAMFINPDNIYETIVEKTNEQLENEDVIESINKFINETIDRILEKQIFEIIPQNSKKELETLITTYIPELMSNINISECITLIVGQDNLYNSLNKLFGQDLENIIKKFLIKKYDELLSQNIINESIGNFIHSIEHYTIPLNHETKVNVIKLIIKKYSELVNNHAEDLVKHANIGKLIEKQINTFDLDVLEEMILSITKKELRSITWLGGVLGFIISLLILVV